MRTTLSRHMRTARRRITHHIAQRLLIGSVLAIVLAGPSLRGGTLAFTAAASGPTSTVAHGWVATAPTKSGHTTPSPALSAPGYQHQRAVLVHPTLTRTHAAVPPGQRRDVPLRFSAAGLAAREQARLGHVPPTTMAKTFVRFRTAPGTSQHTPRQKPNVASGGSFPGSGFVSSIPPDVAMAAGPLNIVEATNDTVSVFGKSGASAFGASLSSTPLSTFFPGVNAGDSTFDPTVIFDPYINRFWLLATTENDTTSQSTLRVAVSNDGDATHGWSIFSLDATIDGNRSSNNWCDWPKIGIDAQAVYFTCNMFAFPSAPPPPAQPGSFQYAKVRVMLKSAFTGGTCCFWTDFWNLRENAFNTAPSFGVQPATMYGASPSNGEFLIDAHGQGGNDGTLQIWHITNAQNAGNTTNPPTIDTQSQGVGSFDVPHPAAQPGSPTGIDTGDTRLLYAFWQNGRLTTGQNLLCPAPNQAFDCLGLTQLDLSAYPTITTVRDWAWGAGSDYSYPAVAANAAGDMTMVFTRSDPATFAEVDQAGIPSGCLVPACTDPQTTVQPGLNTYVNIVPPDPRDRWGDYLSASPDPNGTGIWIAGEFASANPCQCQWATQIELTRPLPITTLSPQTPLSQPGNVPINDHYQFNPAQSTFGGGWNVVALREGADGTSVDDSIALFSDQTFDNVLGGSWLNPPLNDYVAVNNTPGHAPSDAYFPLVQGQSQSAGPYSIEWSVASGTAVLPGGVNDSMGSSNVVRVYNATLSTGTLYYLGLRPPAGGTGNSSRYSLTLHTAGTSNFQGRVAAVADSFVSTPPGQPIFLTYNTGSDPTQTDGVVVLNNNGGSGSYGLYVDSATPSGTLSINGGAPYTNNPNVTLTTSASNPTPGDPVTDMAFSTDGVTYGPWLPYAASAPFVLPTGDGVKRVYVEYRNGAGAVSAPVMASITLDTTPPQTAASVSGTPAGGVNTFFPPVTVILSAVDNLSGVANTVYQLDGGPTQTYSAPFTIASIGKHTLTFHSTDKAGNAESPQSITFTIAWASQNSGTSNGLRSIACATGSVCEIAGLNGTILGTLNGGTTWSTQTSNASSNLNGMACPSTSTCYAVGNAGTIRRTTNGGTTWSPQTSGTIANLYGIACPGVSSCYAVGSTGTILATFNGGATWTKQHSGTLNDLYGMACPSTNTCYAVGRTGTIRRTTNSGVTWSGQASGTTNNLNGVACPSASTCYAVGNAGVIRGTTNGGTTWIAQASGTATNLNSVACPAFSACTSVGGAGTIITTANAGMSWSAQPSGTTNALYGASCPGATTCYAVGDLGTIRRNG